MKHIKEYLSFRDSLNEGPGKGYYIKVAVRDAKKALSILDDMYRKKFDISGSDTYYFKDEDMAFDAKMDLGARDIQVTDTNIEESLDEKAGPCWDGYKIGSPKTKISSQSGKRVNNCVPIDEEVNEKLARGLKPLLKLGSTITKKTGEDALLDLSDKFDSIDDEYAGTIASHLDMAIELMQDGYAGDATKKLKQFNKACKDVLSGKEVGSAFENVNEATYNSKNHIGSTSDGQGSNAEIYKKGKGYYVVVSGEADYDFDAKNDKELLKKLKDNEFDSTDILEVNEAEDYKYKKYVSKAFDKISDAMFEFRNAMGVKQLGQADPKLKKRIEAMQAEIFALRRDMKSEGLTESEVNEATDINDPVLMAFRATRRDLPALKFPKVKSRRLSFDKYMDLLDAEIDIDQQIKDLAQEMGQTLRDMEQEAEPEGGKIADRYGSIMMKQEKEYTKLKAKKVKIASRIEKHRMA